jgi:hypothetical protein
MKQNKITSLILTFLSLTGWGLCCGYHFGWLDDVQDLNIMKGTFVNGCTLFDPDHFILLQNALQWLYVHMPKFPWFGSFLYLLLAYCIYTSANLIVTQFNVSGIITKVCLAVLFIVCFLLESINTINFTEVAILTSGIALINCCFVLKAEKPGWGKLILYLLPWFIALLVRKDAVIFTTVIIGAILFLNAPRNLLRNYLRPVLVLFITLALSMIYVKGYEEQKEEQKQIAAFNTYLFTIQDAYQTNSYSLKTLEDSLLFEAVTKWNFFDKYKFNVALLKRIGYEQPIRVEVLYELPIRLKNLVSESIKYNGYHEIYNWNVKFVFVILINALLLFLQLKKPPGKAWQTAAAHFIFWLSLLFVGVFVKMENRLFFPLCALYTLLNGLFVSMNSLPVDMRKIGTVVSVCALILYAIFAAFMFCQNMNMADEMNDELKRKRAFWQELAQLKNKIIVYDPHALFLLHDTPFKEINLPAKNENIVANHFYLTHFNCLNDYYISRIGSDRIDSIFSYLYANRENVYMIGIASNIDFLERYMKSIHQKEYHFQADTSFHSLEKMDNNFLWIPMKYRVYKFQN